jgi:hypothetical protein
MKRLFFLLICAVLTNNVAKAQERPTHEIHAAMLYNFIKYIQWPNEAEGGDFVVGVVGDENILATLKQWYDGKPKGNKKYVIKKVASTEDATTCQVIYIGKFKNKEFENIKNTISGKSVLTITDGNGMGQKGSCINFKVVDGKLKFELNQSAVSGANLKVSTQLSSMAILI